MILYAISTETAIVGLFLAGIAPGLLTAVLYALMLVLWAKFVPGVGPSERPAPTSLGDKARTLFGCREIILLVVMGTICLGIGMATEAAAFGGAAALLIVLMRPANRGRISGRGLVDVGATTSCVFLPVIGTGLFGRALTTPQVPQPLPEWLTGFDLSRWQLTSHPSLPIWCSASSWMPAP
nr:TRAP transporter large permease subunit [Acuticoccus mangrovi]